MTKQPIIHILLLSAFRICSGMASTQNIGAWKCSFMNDKIYSMSVAGVTSSRSKIDCADNCAEADNCKSFFYNKNTKHCQLHSSFLWNLNPAFVTEAPGYQFYKVREGTNVSLPVDCFDILQQGSTKSGVYTVYPSGNPKQVYCDQETDCGGWLVFQRRKDGSENFYRVWNDYVNGFGDLNNEFWKGNNFLAEIIPLKQYTLRVDLKTFEGETAYAEYTWITVASAALNYRMYVGTYSGTAGESMGRQNGSQFTTKDRDNDSEGGQNCAVQWQGAWWYQGCHNSNLNGIYHATNPSPFGIGVVWKDFKGYEYSLKETEMKIRPSLI